MTPLPIITDEARKAAIQVLQDYLEGSGVMLPLPEVWVERAALIIATAHQEQDEKCREALLAADRHLEVTNRSWSLEEGNKCGYETYMEALEKMPKEFKKSEDNYIKLRDEALALLEGKE